ncbi:hypothetical protein CCACVL1_10528 [Corchorus capsularis]|uniref:Protein kinase domain-containing protein n=1 Tax=Corchorus capsularis TaxID=210143 RepID=A0A1R3IQY0_COCAP|nr:hypothetical protein CCACVL1_10528 [Corchorus capsularis]
MGAAVGKSEKAVPVGAKEVESGGEMGGKLVHFDGPFVFTADDLLCATAEIMGEPMNGMDLPQWVASIVKEEWTNEVFDLELMRDTPTINDELLNTLKLALHCVDPSPAARPEAQQVLQQLEEIKPELAAVAASGDDAAKVPPTSE